MDSFDDVPDTSDTFSKVREGLADEVQRQVESKASEIDTQKVAENALIVVGATATGVILTGAVSYLIDSTAS
jgi:hypothetical protein